MSASYEMPGTDNLRDIPDILYINIFLFLY